MILPMVRGVVCICTGQGSELDESDLTHFVGHFLVGGWPKFDFLGPGPCLVYVCTTFLTVGGVIFNFFCFSLRLTKYVKMANTRTMSSSTTT